MLTKINATFHRQFRKCAVVAIYQLTCITFRWIFLVLMGAVAAIAVAAMTATMSLTRRFECKISEKKYATIKNNARTKKLHAHTFMSRLRLRYGIHLKMLSLNLNISKVKTMALAHMHGVRKLVRNNGFKWLCEQRLMQSHICNIYSKLVEDELILFSVIWIERKISSNALPIACGCCCRSFVCFGFMLLLLHLY